MDRLCNFNMPPEVPLKEYPLIDPSPLGKKRQNIDKFQLSINNKVDFSFPNSALCKK